MSKKVYLFTAKLPREEMFGLISQLRRAPVSVESDIAEGESRYTAKDKLNFLVRSRSSCAEAQTQLLLVSDLYPRLAKGANDLYKSYDDLARQINSLRISYRRRKSHERT